MDETIVDATILHAATSTKNRVRQRDLEMHLTQKGKHWYFGMKAHVGVDSRTKQIRAVVTMAANRGHRLAAAARTAQAVGRGGRNC